MKLRIALVQFGRDRWNKTRNVERMLSTLSEIKNLDVVCLPEAWTGGGELFLEEKERESLLSSLCELAAENNYNLLTGGLFNRRGEKNFDTCHIINRDGKVIGFYDKRFPSTAFNERDFCSPGDASPVFKVDDVKIGIVICVDALYPELARNLALNNACIIFNPSNIPENRSELWKHVSVTRAVENTVFYVFVNNTNTLYPDERMVKGNSLVVAPDGEMILEAGEEEKVFQSDLDLSQIDKIRKRWRYLDDIRQQPVY
ncbi:MAG: carbon-nitrogen hydrolase family protein [Candidatus Bathyarchaeota archaeon]|nr:carbon-nitrogen hydrolase family protein [Candidatus Bathyarchaeota archaeon]MDH5635403.1 carbon-nitrogen hydrolase family protein [Candidatus Bathyarchaeota archaeon]MDH5701400.1 carbon-nitrogen hydrolase family protein [Candidatus Bathyarchaeota archaeon]